MDNKQENTPSFITAKVKMAGNELFFVYLLHLVILVLGMVGFTVLSIDPEYAEKMIKLKKASTISMEVMVYAACPTAFLLSIFYQLVFRQFFHPWKLVRSRIEPGCCPGSYQDCKPQPTSRIVQRRVPIQGSNDRTEMSMAEIRQIPAEKIKGRKTKTFDRRKTGKIQRRKLREKKQWLQSFEKSSSSSKKKRNN